MEGGQQHRTQRATPTAQQEAQELAHGGNPLTFFRKKPELVEARRLRLGNGGGNVEEILAWVGSAAGDPTIEGIPFRQPGGPAWARDGDYVIRGLVGEFYPVKPHVFHATYDGVPDEAAARQELIERARGRLRDLRGETDEEGGGLAQIIRRLDAAIRQMEQRQT